MKPNSLDPNDTNETFDRLVDGELSESQRRELLAGLDDRPDGWRRCALAFLESQCWRRSVGELLRPAPSRTSEVSAEPVMRDDQARSEPRGSESRLSWRHRVGLVAAMAASFLVALSIGWWAQQLRSKSAPAGVGVSNDVAANASPKSPDPWRVVTVADNQQPGNAMNLPAVERDNLDPRWLQEVPPAIPDRVLQALNRTGHEVQQHRELVAVPMQDGRRLLVPVDQVKVHYVGNQTY